MELYKQVFGEDYSLGIRIPEYFEDQSYRNDTGPSFVYVQSHKILKICVLPEDLQHREIENGKRYTLIEMKTSHGDDYQEFVDVRFESESPEMFEQVIFDEMKLKGWLGV
ncbi:hypothetical protein ACH42_06990 [Endozoicomonas sp. (ex Bugula neritina AB1)]|nr:hypothetical protein ACH42_06990 [Endozoicomonas sp. (ex Bugula neritina AB1)]